MLRTRLQRHYAHIEKLEQRYMLSGMHGHGGGPHVTPTAIMTHHDTIPRFVAPNATHNISSGNWSDPSIWSDGEVPGTDEQVRISHHTTVVYDVASNVELDAIEVMGTFQFATDHHTSLYLNELTVMPGAALIVGDAKNPISASAEIVFTDTPDSSGNHFKTGTVNAAGIDPEQWGNGLIAFGEVEIHGRAKTSSYVRLAAEPLAGDTELVLESAPVGWRVGDELVLPDTNPAWHEDRVEELVVAAIDGNKVTLTSPLVHDHPGARLADGTLRYLPHIGNLSRNVVLRSENPAGVRGHVAFINRADVDVRYARFLDLGRTGNEKLDNTSFDTDGLVTSIGTNQAGRYSLHFHHLVGPHNPTNTGYQYQAVGNTVDGGLRWGVVVHGSHYGLVQENFVYDAVGGGIVTEDGTESYNQFDGNFVVQTTGNGFFKTGTAGEAFWFRGPLNEITNNVAANSNRAGFDIFVQNLHSRNRDDMPKPAFRGASLSVDSEVDHYNVFEVPFVGFAGNEVYGSDAVFDSWSTESSVKNYVSDLTGWHTNDNHFSLSSYNNDNLVIEGLQLVGNFAGLESNKLQKYQPVSTIGIEAVRQSTDLQIRNGEIRGVQTGIATPAHATGHMVITDSTIQAYVGVKVNRMTNGGSTVATPDLPYSSLTIENTRFERMPDNARQPEQYALQLSFDTSFSEGTDLTATNEVFLYDFNGVPGADYQVFFHEQAPDFEIPVSVSYGNQQRNFIASPEGGLTNQEAWDKYGVAIAGAVAPCATVDGDSCEAARARAAALGIDGLVFPITDNRAVATADAGTDLTVSQYAEFTLRGDISSSVPFQADWSKVSGPGEVEFGDFNDLSSTAKMNEPGEYVLRLSGTDGERHVYDEVTVTVIATGMPPNRAPSVNAGVDQVLTTTNVASLTGTVTDDDRPNGTLNVHWKVISGPGVATFVDDTAAATTATFSRTGVYTLQLSATDGALTATDDVVVEVEKLVPQQPLIAHWKIDSTDSTTILDSSVHGLDAAMQGGTINDSAIALNGGYIAAPASELLMPTDGLTVGLWINPSAADLSTGKTLAHWDGGSWNPYSLSIRNPNELRVEVITDRGKQLHYVPTQNLSAGQWTHLAVTFSPDNGGAIKVYRDGAQIAHHANAGSVISYNQHGSGHLTFGRDTPTSTGPAFEGSMDDLRIYNYALSAAELRSIMDVVRTVTSPPASATQVDNGNAASDAHGVEPSTGETPSDRPVIPTDAVDEVFGELTPQNDNDLSHVDDNGASTGIDGVFDEIFDLLDSEAA